MLTTLVSEFIKNLFGLLETLNGADIDKRDERVVKHIFDFMGNIFKNAESSLTQMRLSKEFKTSLLDDLMSINEGLLKTVAYLEPKTKTTIENLSLRMKFSNPSMFSSVFDENDGGALIKLKEPVVIDSIKYYREPEPKVPLQSTSISSPVSFESMLISNYFTSEQLATELQDYKVHFLTVPKYNTSDNMSIVMTVKDKANIAMIEFNNLVLVEGQLAFNKMLWHSGLCKYNAYHCLICSVEMSTKSEYDYHILTPQHLLKLSSKKMWIPSLQMCTNIINEQSKMVQCCICSDRMDIMSIENHIKSSHRLQKNDVSQIGSGILSQLRLKLWKEPRIGSKIFEDTFKDLLDQHQIDINEKGITCETCATSLSSDLLENLYVHISGHKHRKLYDSYLRSKFEKIDSVSTFSVASGNSYRGFIHMYQNKNVSHCIICNILIKGSSIHEANKHITGHCHSSLLILYLSNHKLPPLKNLNINMGTNVDLEPYHFNTNKFASICKPKDEENKPIHEPKIILETQSKVILDSDIVFDKCSWNVMKLEHYEYYCVACCENVEIRNFSKHISSDRHKENIKDWHIMKAYPTIKKGNKSNSIFCMSCKEFFKETAWMHHVLSEDHKKETEKCTVDSAGLKKCLDKII